MVLHKHERLVAVPKSEVPKGEVPKGENMGLNLFVCLTNCIHQKETSI